MKNPFPGLLAAKGRKGQKKTSGYRVSPLQAILAIAALLVLAYYLNRLPSALGSIDVVNWRNALILAGIVVLVLLVRSWKKPASAPSTSSSGTRYTGTALGALKLVTTLVLLFFAGSWLYAGWQNAKARTTYAPAASARFSTAIVSDTTLVITKARRAEAFTPYGKEICWWTVKNGVESDDMSDYTSKAEFVRGGKLRYFILDPKSKADSVVVRVRYSDV